MARRTVILGWDSATFDVADPMMSAGRLPVLADLCGRGRRAPLRSVWPPMTDCAWTSAFTGQGPEVHGIFGSWYRAPGAYACRYFSARDRRAPALWEMASDARIVVFNVPMTYPPGNVNGAMVAGYGAPFGSRFCLPDGLQDELAARWPLEDLLDRAPRGGLDRFLADLVRGLDAQARAIVWLTERFDAEIVIAVWPQIDRAQHFMWRFRDRDHPLADAVAAVYEAADRATGTIVENLPDADVIVVSDHGAGLLRGDVNLGAWLTGRGLARPGSRGSLAGRLGALAYALPPSVRRAARRAAPGLARRAIGADLSGSLAPFDWDSTSAFVGFHGDLWLNLRGREARGTVDPSDAPDLVAEIAAGLEAVVDPRDGRRVIAEVLPRERAYGDDPSGLAPDAVIDSWSAGYRVAPTRDPAGEVVTEPSTLSGVSEAWSADHRPDGIFVAAGPRIAPGRSEGLSLVDVAPIALALLDRPIPEGLQGRVPPGVLDPGWLATHPIVGAERAARRPEQGGYTDEEARAVADHLRDLGYLE